MDCIFCKIANKEIPSTTIYEDELVIAFKDLDPKAPIHLLIIPKKHITSIADTTKEDKEILGHIMTDVVPKIAKDLQLDETGFRLVTNMGEDGGQTVKHLHFHLLGGRSMTWPPG